VIRRTLLTLGTATFAVVAAALGAFGFIQTDPGRAWLAATLSRVLSSPEAIVTLDGIEGTIPFDMRVRQIRLADSGGAWLIVSDAAIDIAAGELLRRKLTARRLAASDITVLRTPTGSKPASTEQSDFISIPDLPVDVVIRSLDIGRIQLEEPVLGEPVTLALTGHGSLDRSGADAQLSIERVDGGAGHARLSLHLQAPEMLTLHVDVAEPSGLLLKRALGRDEALPLNATIDGEGPIDMWRGKLLAKAGDAAHAEADFTLARNGGYRIASEGVLAVAGLLPPDIARLVSEPLRYSTTAAMNGDVVTVETLNLSGGATTLRVSGHYNTAAQTFAGEAAATISDLEPLAGLIGTPLAGTTTVTIKADGAPATPRAHVELSAKDLRRGEIGAGSLSANFDAQRGNGTWRVTGAGAADALAWPADLAGVPQRVEWEAAGEGDEAFSRIALDHLVLRAGDTEINASGTAEALDQSPRVKVKARLAVANLAQWKELAGLPLEGRLTLDIDAMSETGAVTAKLEGQAQELTSGQAALDALLGNAVALSGTVSRSNEGTIAFDSIRIDGAHLTASANVTMPADFSRLDATAHADAKRLDVLSTPLGTAIRGAMTVNAQVNGELARPNVKAQAVASDLRLDTRRLDRITADLALTDIAAPAGTFAATFRAGQLDGKASADFARTGPDTLAISKLSVAAPGSDISGTLNVRTDTLLASGNLAARVADLDLWSVLAGTRLAGSVDARAALSARDGQRADIDVTARSLRFDDAGAAIANLKIEARLADLFTKPSGKATVEGKMVTAPDLRADNVRMTAQSSKPGVFSVGLDAQGALRPAADQSAFRLSAAGEVAIADQEQRVRLTRLTGRLGDYDISSQAPLTVAVGADRLHLEGLDLRIGQGRLSGTASRTGQRLAIKADIRNLPVALIELAAPRQKVSGTLDGSINVAGSVARPDGQFDARLRNLRLAESKDIPPLAIAARGTWKDARLDVTGRIDGPGGTGLDLTGALPLALDPNSLAPIVARDGAIRAEARGNGRIESWASALPLGEDRVSGRYEIDVFVRGTLNSPEAGGHLTVADGRYLNFAAGTELRNVSLELVGDGRHFTIKQLAATDTATGTITGGGFIDLAAVPGPAVDFSATFANFQALRRDDVTATTEGELRLSGTLDAATLSGRIQIDRAEIRIPERMPPNIAHLDVIEIDSRGGAVPTEPEKTESEMTLRFDLDIHIPARAFVRGRGLDSEWRGQVHVTGTSKEPLLSGKLETVRGSFSLLGKRFVLSNGSIEFDGGKKIDPQLNIVAEHRTASITAQALVTGPASGPTIKLTSDPEMPQDEVLARVLFGRGAGDITAAQALELAQAAATLAGRGGGPGLLDRIRATVGLDRLDISSGETSSDGTTGTKITAGEYVTERVFVGVEQGTTAESTRSKVEVEITPNLSVESSVGATSAGVGVNWKWDY
jgi:translocation and assembly module TamB